MNEFIVWDKILKKFIGKSGKTTDMCTMRNDGLLSLDNDAEMFFYIGLKDINNNKIYADCSIVEFEKYARTYKGVFEFDKCSLSYRLRVIKTTDTSIIENEFTFDYIEINECNFKIIDTIQQKKLGLIK